MKGPLYHMVFATDNDAGDKIMADIYAKRASQIPQMRQEARDRMRGQATLDLGDTHDARRVVQRDVRHLLYNAGMATVTIRKKFGRQVSGGAVNEVRTTGRPTFVTHRGTPVARSCCRSTRSSWMPPRSPRTHPSTSPRCAPPTRRSSGGQPGAALADAIAEFEAEHGPLDEGAQVTWRRSRSNSTAKRSAIYASSTPMTTAQQPARAMADVLTHEPLPANANDRGPKDSARRRPRNGAQRIPPASGPECREQGARRTSFTAATCSEQYARSATDPRARSRNAAAPRAKPRCRSLTDWNQLPLPAAKGELSEGSPWAFAARLNLSSLLEVTDTCIGIKVIAELPCPGSSIAHRQQHTAYASYYFR